MLLTKKLVSLFTLLCFNTLLFAQYEISSTSYFGDKSDDDAVMGAVILSDGTIVLAAQSDPFTGASLEVSTIEGASVAMKGSIVRLSSDGRKILSITKVSESVYDLAVDAKDRLYVAAGKRGVLQLDANVSQLLWERSADNGQQIHRVDVSAGGICAALSTGSGNLGDMDTKAGKGAVFLWDAEGNSIGGFEGKHNTHDVAVDENSQTIISVGWRQASVSGVPVQIAYMYGKAYDGEHKYTAYSWSTNKDSDIFINKPENNMADTRAYRCTIGADGKLYAAFECAGGNHIFRYDPMDLSEKVNPLLKRTDDFFSNFSNSKSEHKTFVGKYEPASGELIQGAEICARLGSNGRANTLRVKGGSIAADADGYVYLGGSSAYGLPMPPNPRYTASDGEITFSPTELGDYVGGAFLMVLAPDFSYRRYTTRLNVGGLNRAIAVGPGKGDTPHLVWGGRAQNKNPLYTTQSWQGQAAGGENDGFFAVIGEANKTTSLARELKDGGMSVYPNPSREGFYLYGESKKVNMYLHDMQGRRIKTMSNVYAPIYFAYPEELTEGFYMLVVESEGKRYFSKVVKY